MHNSTCCAAQYANLLRSSLFLAQVSDRSALRKAHPAAASGFGMVAPLESDHMLPRERYRWIQCCILMSLIAG